MPQDIVREGVKIVDVTNPNHEGPPLAIHANYAPHNYPPAYKIHACSLGARRHGRVPGTEAIPLQVKAWHTGQHLLTQHSTRELRRKRQQQLLRAIRSGDNKVGAWHDWPSS